MSRSNVSAKSKYTFEERLPYLLAFFIPVLLMIGVFVGNSIYPFGQKSFLRTDMYHQYAPFFQTFLRKLKAGESLTYAFEIGLGSNYVALIAYYLSCPLNLLLLVLPEKFIVEFMTYSIVLKIGLCGLSMAIYLNSKSMKRNIGLAFFGISYALCGYVAAYSWCLMWLDVIWLAPLVLLGLERLVRDHKPLLYCITLAVSILTNYYISIMLCIFLVLYFICLMIIKPSRSLGDWLSEICMFGFFSLVAGGIAAVLLIPAAYALMGTASANSTFPSTLTRYFSVIEMLARQLVDVECEEGLEHWPNIYSGIITLVFIPMYYMNRRVNFKEKVFKTILLGIMLLSFSLNIPNYIWHGLHYPNSLPCRQSYLYTILLLSMCYEGYKGFKGISKGKLVGIFWGITAFCLVCEKLVTAPEFHFHVFYVSIVFAGLYILLLYLYRSGKLLRSTACILMIAVLALENGLNTAYTSVTTTSRSEYWNKTDTYQMLLEAVTDDEFYRVEKDPDLRKTKNDAAWVGYDSASIFSSTTYSGISDIYKRLGLEGNTNAYSFKGATPFTASLLNVRYLLTTEELPDSSLYDLKDYSADGVYLYENLYTLPLGFMIPDDTNELWRYTATNPAKTQNSLVNLLTEQSDLLESLPGTSSGSIFTTKVTERAHVYVYVENNQVDNVDATIGDSSMSFSNVKRHYLLDLGYCEPGESIRLSTDDEGQTLSASAYTFDEEGFIEVYEKLAENGLTVKQNDVVNTLTEVSVTGTFTADEEGDLFISIPYDKGWSVTLDGVPAEIEAFDDAFILVHAEAGTHTITLSYVPEGMVLGLCVSGVSLLLLLLSVLVICLIDRKKKHLAPDPAAEDVADVLELPDTQDEPLSEEVMSTEEDPLTLQNAAEGSEASRPAGQRSAPAPEAEMPDRDAETPAQEAEAEVSVAGQAVPHPSGSGTIIPPACIIETVTDAAPAASAQEDDSANDPAAAQADSPVEVSEQTIHDARKKIDEDIAALRDMMVSSDHANNEQ